MRMITGVCSTQYATLHFIFKCVLEVITSAGNVSFHLLFEEIFSKNSKDFLCNILCNITNYVMYDFTIFNIT